MLQESKYHKKHLAIFIKFILAKKYLKCERKTFILPHCRVNKKKLLKIQNFHFATRARIRSTADSYM